MKHLLSLAVATLPLGGGFAHAQLRVVNFNVASLNGNQTALQAVFAATMSDDKPGFAMPPALFVFQEVQSSDVGPLGTRLNAAAAAFGVTYTQGTFTYNTPPNTNEDGSAGAQAMFYRATVLTEDASGHVDINTLAGRNSDRWRLLLVGYDSPVASFYIYSSHFKASNTSADATTRLNGATAIRNNADALPAGTHLIYAGDFNVYHNNEGAYLKFLSAGAGQAFDPLGAGSWAGSGNAIKHTQAPCATGCALVGGGMDDRFDQQLPSLAFNDGEGLAIMTIPWAYRTLGNDGAHYDQAINSGTNTYYPADIPRSNALAANLFTASDHCPVIVDYQVPAVMSAALTPDFGRIIQNATFDVQLAVSNVASVVVSAGADELDYDANGTGAISGSAGGSVLALTPPQVSSFNIDTSVVGPANGSVQVTSTSQAAQNGSIELFTGGTIVRPANASFSAGSDLDSTSVSALLASDSGVQNIPVDVYNFGYDAFQATLDIDGVSGLSGPFGLAGGLTTGVGAGPATLTFSVDTTGAAPGLHQQEATIFISDEDLPGASSSIIDVTFNVQIVVPGLAADINCDDVVDLADVETLADVLLGVDLDSCHVGRADVDQSGLADGDDIPAFMFAFLNA